MLYSEFLNGTGAPENKYTYREYERINNIYNHNLSMSKEEAYSLYIAPDDFIQDLLTELSFYKDKNSEKSYQISKLEKETQKLKDEIKSLEAVRNSLKYTLEDCLREAETHRNRISNLIYG